ncbi:hypothetical protein KC347_g215 [Hortaea werneckii]|nr:hypothetical protein KC347_g215 [Hortaea werneckii]
MECLRQSIDEMLVSRVRSFYLRIRLLAHDSLECGGRNRARFDHGLEQLENGRRDWVQMPCNYTATGWCPSCFSNRATTYRWNVYCLLFVT